MESTATGNSAIEAQPEEAASPPVPPAGEAPRVGSPPAGKPPRERNWTLIGLIAVSCIALLLLGSTITLAAVGDFGGQKPGFRFERSGGRDVGPMQRPDGSRMQMPGRRFRQQENSNDGNEQTKPPEKQPPEKQPSDTQPESTAPETAVTPLEQAS